MKKRLISLIVAVVMLFSMLCPAVYADDETVSFDTCTHDWVTPIRSGYSVSVPGTDYSISVKTEQCSKCKWYKHIATLIFAEFTYYSPLNVDANGLIPTELTTYWLNVWYNTFGKNATATKFTPGGGSTSGGGVGRPKGYADDSGTPSVGSTGAFQVVAHAVYNTLYYANSAFNTSWFYEGNYISSDGCFYLRCSQNSIYVCNTVHDGKSRGIDLYYTYMFDAPVDGLYYCDPSTTIDGYWNHSNLGVTQSHVNVVFSEKFSSGENQRFKKYGEVTITAGEKYGNLQIPYSYTIKVHDLILNVIPDTVSIKQYSKITINNNIWNGNIYTDNSTNLTYIYPQYTTVNEKNETVTNISNNPIIYNSETKQYYTYDQTTKNYYYITYNAQPTPSPSPTPAPTEKPGGSISTPETGKPGGDTGDTTGILAVLVEIRDNMIQGFLDIKAAFVAGFAELSANFTLAIENLNVNIQNVFNKKFPDQSTPETALPSPTPSPSPAPTDPPSPSPAPDPGKPDSGDKTNNFWTIIFPNGGGSEDGKKGIFWALVSLILALIAFFANLAVGVGYLFPFLPDGVVMTINTCLIVIFLFTIIKFIMRSK